MDKYENIDDDEKELDIFETKRKERQEENVRSKKRTGTGFGIFLILVIIGVSAIYINREKVQPFFNELLGGIDRSQSAVIDDDLQDSSQANRINIESSARATFVGYGKNFMYCTKDGMKLFDQNQNQIWTYTYTMAAPVVINDGSSTVVYENQGRNIRVYNEKGEMYSIRTDGPIVQVEINKNGCTAVMINNDSGYKTQVYNQVGELLMERVDQDFGIYPLSLDLSEDSGVLVVSYLDTNDIELVGKVIFFYTSKGGAIISETGDFFASVSKKGTLISSIKCIASDRFIAIGDNRIMSFDNEGNELWEIEINNKIDKIAFGNDRYVTIAYGDEFPGKDGFDKGTVISYDQNGKIVFEIPMNKPVTYLAGYKDGVVIGANRDFVCANYSGSIQWSHTATQDIKDIVPLNSLTQVLYVTNSYGEITDMRNK